MPQAARRGDCSRDVGSRARCRTRKPASGRLALSDLGRIDRIVDRADVIGRYASRPRLAITLACVWQNGNAEARPTALAP